MTTPSLNTYLRNHVNNYELFARLASNAGDHMDALLHLVRAETFERSRYLLHAVKRNGHAERDRCERNANNILLQIGLVRLVVGLQHGQITGEPGTVDVNGGHYYVVPQPTEPQISADVLQLLVDSRPSS